MEMKGLIVSLERGINLLELISKEKSITFDEIVSKSKIPRSSVFRLLSSLESLGYLERKKINDVDCWNLGLRILTIANRKISQMDIRTEIHDILENLAKAVDEFVQLGVLYEGKVTYIDMVKRSKPLIFYADIGSRIPINVSAAGLVLAASLEDDELEKLVNKQSFTKNTLNTIVDPIKLIDYIKKVAEDGFAVDDQMYAIGIRCIAAPIFNYLGQVIAAINITGSVSTITDERIEFFLEKLKVAAKKASLKMGYKLEEKGR